MEKSGLFLCDLSVVCGSLRNDVCSIALTSVGHVLGNTASKGVPREHVCQGAAAPLWTELMQGIQVLQWCLKTAVTRREFLEEAIYHPEFQLSSSDEKVYKSGSKVDWLFRESFSVCSAAWDM